MPTVTNPTTDNSTAQALNSAENAAIEAVVTAAETAAIAAYPFLGYPGIKQIWEALAGYFAQLFSNVAQTGTTFLVIDSEVGSEQTALSSALQDLIAAEKSGDANAIQKAIQVYANAQSALTHDDGSSSAIH